MTIAALWSQPRVAGLNGPGKSQKKAEMRRDPSGLCLTACQDLFFFSSFLATNGLVTLAVAACDAVASHS